MHFAKVATVLMLMFFTQPSLAAIFASVSFDDNTTQTISKEDNTLQNYFDSKGEMYFWRGFRPLNMLSGSEIFYAKKENKKLIPLSQNIPSVYSISLTENSVSQVAQKSWDELFLENKNRADFLYAYAMYLKATSDYSKALAVLDRATKVDPNYALAYFLKGDIYRVLGEYKKAVLSYVATIQVNPYCTDAYFNIAKIFEEFSEIELALDFYRYAYSINPKDIEIRNSIIRLQRQVAKL